MSRSRKRADPDDWIAPSLRALAMPIDAIMFDDRNARQHPRANIDAIRASIERFGQTKPIVVHRGSRVCCAGNGFLQAATEAGRTRIAVAWFEGTAAQARAYAIADNASADLAEWHLPELHDALRDLDGEFREMFAALALPDVFDSPASDSPASDSPAGRKFCVIVETTSEAEQRKVVELLEREGHTCQLFMR